MVLIRASGPTEKSQCMGSTSTSIGAFLNAPPPECTHAYTYTHNTHIHIQECHERDIWLPSTTQVKYQYKAKH